MKKYRITIALILLLVLCALSLTACNSSLGAPTGLMLDVETQTLSWKMVQGAKFYTIQISGQERELTTKTNTISLEDLDPGEYEIRVKANGDGEIHEDSDWAVYHFTREYETGLRYKLINNDTAYQLVGGGKATGDVVMEDTFRGKPVIAIADKALYGNNKITSFTVGNNVKTIGEKSFGKCSMLTSVAIPEGVTSIGSYAFQSCKALTSVVLPDSVTTITPYMFAYCRALTNVTMGQYVTSIGEYAFDNCEALVSITYTGDKNAASKVTIPDSVQVIGGYAFSDCIGITKVDTGDGVKVIGPYAFSSCRALTDLKIGQGVLQIAQYAFARCSALTAVSIPDNTQILGEAAFYDCTMLSDVSLGTGLTNIARFVFTDTAIMKNANDMLVIDGWLIELLDRSIVKLSLSEGVHGIANYAAAYCENLVQADFKGVKYVGVAALAQNPKLYRISFDDALLELGDYALYGCAFLENVSLGNNLRSIGNYAFQDCSKLENTVVIPESVTYIGTRAFRGTAAYSAISIMTGGVVYMGNWAVDYQMSLSGAFLGSDGAVVLQEGTRGIASYAFSNKSIRSITMPDSVETICRGAFYKCTSYYINIPASVKYIGDYAFYGCGSTNFGGTEYNLVIPEGTTYIGRSAFNGCTYVLSATIPGSVKTIGAYAFYNCPLLGATVDITVGTGETDEEGNPITTVITVQGFVSLGEGIETIGERAFQGCVMLSSVEVPNSVTSLGARAFYKCESLKNVTLGSGLIGIADYTFYKCSALESVTISGNLETIGNYAFRGCVALKDITLENVKTIGRYSFYDCKSLSELVLPGTLTAIGDHAFRGCTGMTSIVIPASVTAIGKHTFYGLNQITLYCQADAVQPEWHVQYNSSYRPVFWGCKLSDDGKYIVSFTTGAGVLDNVKATNGISDPCRDGYTFLGWATEQGSTTVAYTSENVSEAADGVVLYAVWTQNPSAE